MRTKQLLVEFDILSFRVSEIRSMAALQKSMFTILLNALLRPEIQHEICGTLDGFGGLVVRMLASGSRVRGFKPGQSRWIFLCIKILSMPSFGGEVK
jgi:hypothetical protein